MFSSIKHVIEDVKQGVPVVILDDEERENEGDLIVAAEHVSAEKNKLYGDSWSWTDLPYVDIGTSNLSRSFSNG